MRFTLKHNINVAVVFFVGVPVVDVAALTLRRCNGSIAALQQFFRLDIKES
jgi:hypothetical protein